MRSIKEDLVDTKLSLDLAFANAKTQIDNSMITRIKKVTQLAQVLSNTKKTISRANFFD
jgi:hypothetical protein